MKLEDQYNELREFVRRITLSLQSHRSKTEQEMDVMFQDAYRLYVKHDMENEGNTENDPCLFCTFPDCGCDGHRLCQAKRGPNYSARAWNIEKRKTKPA